MDVLCSELVCADLVTALAFPAAHPEMPDEQVVHFLHWYLRGGVPALEDNTKEKMV